MRCIVSSSTGGKEGHCMMWRRGMAQGYTGATTYQLGQVKDRAGICHSDLVTGCGTKGNQLSIKYLTQTPLEDKPRDKII